MSTFCQNQAKHGSAGRLAIAAKAGASLVSHIFVHAWSGCDTTSATFGQGKTDLLKKLNNSQQISSLMIDSIAQLMILGLDYLCTCVVVSRQKV